MHRNTIGTIILLFVPSSSSTLPGLEMGHEIGEVDVLDSGLSRTEDVAAAFAETNTSAVEKAEACGVEHLAMDVVPIQTVSETDHQLESEKDGNLGVSGDDGRHANKEVEEEEERGFVAEEEGEENGEDNVYLCNEIEDDGGDGDDYSDHDGWVDDDDDEEDDFMEEDDDDDDLYEDEDEDEDEDDDVGFESNLGNVNGGSEEGITGSGSGKNENEVKGVQDADEKLMEQSNGNTEIESSKIEDKEKVAEKLEPGVGKSMMKKKKKKKNNLMEKVVRNDSDRVVSANKGIQEVDDKNDSANGEKGRGKEKVVEKGEGSSKKNISRSRRRDKNKEDKLNSKSLKKGFPKRAESMGMIFMCSSETKKDCYRYKVLGLPAGKRDLVEKIYRGMRLFLYDVDLKLLYGIYKAAGRGGYNIEPKAFNSKFPSQVRFTVLEDCIPLAEEKFRKAIKENYFTKKKFDCQLNHEQVKNLCKLFIASSKGPKSKRLDRTRRPKVQTSSMRQDRSRVQGLTEVRRRDRSRAHVLDEGRRDRSRTHVLDEWRRDRSRTHVLDEGRRVAVDERYQHDNYYHVRSREIAVSPVDRAYKVDPVPPLLTAPRYTYDRPSERDAYRPNILAVENRDAYRQPPLTTRDAYRQRPLSPLVPRDTYRHRPLSPSASRDSYMPLSDYLDAYRPGPVLDLYHGYRRDGVPEHRDLRPTNLEVRRRDDIEPARDPSLYHREPQLYHDDPVYITGEPHRYRPERTEYRSRVSPVSEYRSTRGLYRY